jgi:hypothetical protein
MAEIKSFDIPVVGPEFIIKNKTGITRTKRTGTVAREVAVVTFDTAALDSSGVANTTVAAHGLGVYLPAKAIITKVFIQIVSGFTSAASTATIALSAEAANDLFSALAVSDTKLSTGPFTAGVPDGTVTNTKQTTVVREITATVAVQALTAGKMNIFIDYMIAE